MATSFWVCAQIKRAVTTKVDLGFKFLTGHISAELCAYFYLEILKACIWVSCLSKGCL